MNDDAFIRLLAGIDRPRQPRPEFASALRAELIEASGSVAPTQPAIDLGAIALTVPTGRRGLRRGSWIAAAAVAATVLVVAVAVSVLGPSDNPAASRGSPRILDVGAAEMACTTFDADAFGPLGRARVLGLDNAAAFRNQATAAATTDQLLRSLRDLRGALHDAGIGAALAPIDVAIGRTQTAVNWVDAGDLVDARAGVQPIERLLVDAAAKLMDQGVAACFG